MAAARVVPRVPDRRRWWALAGAGALLVGVVAPATGWALGTGAGWVAVPLATVVVLAAVVLSSAVRENGAGRSLWCDDGVLAGRTLLGWHGVDLTEVQAVAVEEDDGEPTGLLLADGGGHLRVPWPEVARLPEVRVLLLARQAQGAVVLPRLLCAAWGVPPLPDAPETGRVPGRLRDVVAVLITGLTVVGALVSGLLAALVALR
ncbi:hypothetical protein JD79_03468 [Geodermatophilus normandii]|uniref:PH domain-containing protein n=1 Tax=Geodermatophilus normandii TaxID=1137989 RepID=A0A317QMN0_9ACTN|nr:hypothetical protein [Geodermatophilus normandii]PWW24289.1 hypothetical protein JD79_03468 [Geodermatophilus normandii]